LALEEQNSVSLLKDSHPSLFGEERGNSGVDGGPTQGTLMETETTVFTRAQVTARQKHHAAIRIQANDASRRIVPRVDFNSSGGLLLFGFL
jgi:hypothetical protein